MRPADPCGPTGRSRCYSDARRILYSFANEKVEALRVVVNDDGLALRGAKQAMLTYKFGWWTEEMSATRNIGKRLVS